MCPPSGLASNISRASERRALGTLTFADQHYSHVYQHSYSHLHGDGRLCTCKSTQSEKRNATYLIPLLFTHALQILPLTKPRPSLSSNQHTHTHLPFRPLSLPLPKSYSKLTAFEIIISNPPNPSTVSLTARLASAVTVISALTIILLTPCFSHADAMSLAGPSRLK
jgi:hypothetical protein